MKSLRASVVRLAHDHPEFRQELLGVLKKAAETNGWGPASDGKTYSVSFMKPQPSNDNTGPWAIGGIQGDSSGTFAVLISRGEYDRLVKQTRQKAGRDWNEANKMLYEGVQKGRDVQRNWNPKISLKENIAQGLLKTATSVTGRTAKRATHLENPDKKGFTMCGEKLYPDTKVESVKDATCFYCKQAWEKGVEKKAAATPTTPIGKGKNGYIAFYKGKQVEVMADTKFQAQTTAAAYFKAKKSWEVTVELAEKDGEQVTHKPMFASKVKTAASDKAIMDLMTKFKADHARHAPGRVYKRNKMPEVMKWLKKQTTDKDLAMGVWGDIFKGADYEEFDQMWAGPKAKRVAKQLNGVWVLQDLWNSNAKDFEWMDCVLWVPFDEDFSISNDLNPRLNVSVHDRLESAEEEMWDRVVKHYAENIPEDFFDEKEPETQYVRQKFLAWVGGKGKTASRKQSTKKTAKYIEELSQYADDLVLWIDNDGKLNPLREAIHKNMMKKMVNGSYNHVAAAEAWAYLAEAGAKALYKANDGSVSYTMDGKSVDNEDGIHYNSWHDMFPMSVRKEVAKYLADYFVGQVQNEEYTPDNFDLKGKTVSESVLNLKVAAQAVYYSVKIPPAGVGNIPPATQWHDHSKTLTRGAFKTEAEAHAWADKNIPGHEYEVVTYDDLEDEWDTYFYNEVGTEITLEALKRVLSPLGAEPYSVMQGKKSGNVSFTVGNAKASDLYSGTKEHRLYFQIVGHNRRDNDGKYRINVSEDPILPYSNVKMPVGRGIVGDLTGNEKRDLEAILKAVVKVVEDNLF